MSIPVYVVTGFLESGKTTFLNNFLNKSYSKNKKILILQFEEGEVDFKSNYNNCRIFFPIVTFEKDKKRITNDIHHTLTKGSYDEVWIEWNGCVPFSQLQSLLLQPILCDDCRIMKVIHITKSTIIKNLLGKTGAALPEQISNSDFAVISHTVDLKERHHLQQILQSINSGLKLYQFNSPNKLYQQTYVKRKDPISNFFIQLLSFILFYLILVPVLEYLNLPINKTVINFIGVLLQALPFLLIGVLLSSAIQVFITNEFIERRFPKALGPGMMIALLMGFCLPVCDCASIPIFRSLIKKGIPLPVAVTFMTAAPVINPVVMLSTYYAFSGNWSIVITRVGLGMLSALVIGLISGSLRFKGNIFVGGYDRILCSCGCYEFNEANTTLKMKFDLFVRHSQMEFFSVGKYLLIGILISSVVQSLNINFVELSSGNGYILSIFIMMVMAFVLSLCSSSDAVIARSFANQMPFGAIMGFLVFGPMTDIKNVLMLSAGFSKKFVATLVLITFLVCFAIVFLYTKFIIGGI